MIYGIGTDVVHIPRVANALTRHGARLAQRLLTTEELAIFAQHRQPAQFLARRFAAKEATAKALGTGFSAGLFFNHIGVTNDVQGRPCLRFFAMGLTLYERFNITAAHVSLSDDGEYAVAFVTLECHSMREQR